MDCVSCSWTRPDTKSGALVCSTEPTRASRSTSARAPRFPQESRVPPRASSSRALPSARPSTRTRAPDGRSARTGARPRGGLRAQALQRDWRGPRGPAGCSLRRHAGVRSTAGRHTLGRYAGSSSPRPRSAAARAQRRRRAAPFNGSALRATGTTPTAAALRDHLLADDPAAAALRERRDALAKEREDLDVPGDTRHGRAAGRSTAARPTSCTRATSSSPASASPPTRPRRCTRSAEHERDRLGLAEWLFDPANPAHRAGDGEPPLGAASSGAGSSATEDDFGAQGALPSQP
jgi:hypothetical protein